MRIFSGIQPTGTKHLGNYSGGFRQYAATQAEADESFFCLVDLHSITVGYDPDNLRTSTLDLAAMLFATGLEADRSTVFVQSHVTAHAEANWLLGSVTSFGELRRMTQFKDKSATQDFVSGSWRISVSESVTAVLNFFRTTSGSSTIRTTPCGAPRVVDMSRSGSWRFLMRAPSSG